jgi:hypothetical protein
MVFAIVWMQILSHFDVVLGHCRSLMGKISTFGGGIADFLFKIFL